MLHSTKTRSGFTMIELTVVIGIIAALLALIIPAVQKVREAASRLTCTHNLRQLVLAAINYDASYNSLPPGYLGPLAGGSETPAPYQRAGSLAVLLPYLDQNNLYKQLVNPSNPSLPFDFRIDVGTNPWYSNTADFGLAKTKLKLFVCPSDTPEANTRAVGLFVHWDGTGPNPEFIPNASGGALGRSNYVGVCGTAGSGGVWAKYEGVMGNRSQVRLSTLALFDGASNTLMFGETLFSNDPGLDQPGVRHYAASWMGVGAGGTLFGMPDVTEPPWYCFSGRHVGGLVFAWADGHVSFLRRGNTAIAGSPDWTLFQELAGYKDGAVTDSSSLGF